MNHIKLKLRGEKHNLYIPDEYNMNNNHEIKISVHAKNRIDQGRNGKPIVKNGTVVTVLPKKPEDKNKKNKKAKIQKLKEEQKLIQKEKKKRERNENKVNDKWNVKIKRKRSNRIKNNLNKK
jgi:hypothetical protein